MRAALIGGLGVLLGLALPRAAAAFWPFTRDMRVSLPDSATVARGDSLFEIWKVGGDLAPRADSTGAGPGAPQATGGLRTVITRAGSQPGNTTPPPGLEGTGPSGAGAPTGGGDTSGTPPDSSATPTPSPSEADSAQADSTGADQGPFPGLQNQGTTNTGPLTGAAAAAVVALGFTPRLESGIQSASDYMRTTNTMSVNFNDPSGATLNSSLNYLTEYSFTQGSDTRTSGITNGIDVPVRKLGMRFGLSTLNNRRRQEGARNISNAAIDNFQQSQRAQASAYWARRLVEIPGLGSLRPALRGWNANLFYARRAGTESNSTVATQGAGAGQTRHHDTGNSYGVGISFNRFQWIAVRARAGRSRLSNRDQTALDQPEVESTSQGDTATVNVDMPNIWKLTNVTLQFSTNEGSETSVTNARSSTGSQIGTVGSYVLDTHALLRNQVSLAAQYQWWRFGLKASGDVGRNYDNYVIRTNLFNDTHRYGYVLDSKFNFWKDITLLAKYERRVSDVDQDLNGSENPATRSDKGRKLYLEGSKQVTQTMNVKLYGEVQLDQAYYVHEGPTGLGDRDELRQRVGVDFTGAIGSRITTQATLYYRTYDQAFIDARQSRQSRDESEYVVRPSYTWALTDRVTLRQDFGLASKVIEAVFDSTQNTLNRNHYMSTNLSAALTDRLQMNLTWDYRLQDNGGYFTPGGSSTGFFSPTARTKTDGLGVGVNYVVIPNGKLTFTSRQDAQRVHSFTFTNAKPQLRRVTDSGNLAIGFDSTLNLKSLKLDCHARRNQSFNVSLNRKVYYNVDATLSYTF